MPLIKQKFIYRSDLKDNPSVHYLFGDNICRKGFGGQAKEMRGERNAIGVATKKLPSQFNDSYFSDVHYELWCNVIKNDLMPAFEILEAGGIVVLPSDGLGTGLSELPTRAPRTNEFLEKLLTKMKEIK
jgi:hypothetical protein